MPRAHVRKARAANRVKANHNAFKAAIAIYALLILFLFVVYAGDTHSQMSLMSSNYQSALSSLQQSNLQIYNTYSLVAAKIQTPDLVNLANDSVVNVTTYYPINFTAPYDGYLLLYINYTDAVGYDFTDTSNVSESYYFNTPAVPETRIMGENNVSAYILSPTATGVVKQLYVMPVLRGNDTFFIVSSQVTPVTFRFSLQYVGEPFANVTIDRNYT